jgi:hypothetical protein
VKWETRYTVSNKGTEMKDRAADQAVMIALCADACRFATASFLIGILKT